jgi:hypothetical protein
MTVLILSLVAIELVTYFLLLGRLATVMRVRRPTLFAAVGAPGPSDYLMFAFGPGDGFISRLESHRTEVADEPHILKLMRAARATYIALIVTVCAGLVVMVAYAN